MFVDTFAAVPLQSGDGGGVLGMLIPLALLVIVVAGMWKAFEKAGEAGWLAIIPIVNLYIMIKISGNAWWWLILMFVPLLNIIAFAKISIDVADEFGQGLLFGVGLWLLGFVFWPLLGFGDYEYRGTTEDAAV